MTSTTVSALDHDTLHRLRDALNEVLDTHRAECEVSEGPEADAHRAVCDSAQAALDRMADGTYGHCTHCNSILAVERLEIIPQAELCMDCHDRRNRLYG